MVLYHGSSQIVNNPKIIQPNRGLDFGNGFYTTSNKEQALNFALKVSARRAIDTPFVSVYNFDEGHAKNNLKILSFKSANRKWLDFVISNRKQVYTENEYDLIIGAVADDTIYNTIVLYERGQISFADTLRRLKIQPLFNQYVFCSEKAITYLKFTSEIKVKSDVE